MMDMNIRWTMTDDGWGLLVLAVRRPPKKTWEYIPLVCDNTHNPQGWMVVEPGAWKPNRYFSSAYAGLSATGGWGYNLSLGEAIAKAIGMVENGS